MLPPAHAAAGYALGHFLAAAFPEADRFWMEATGIMFGVAPDIIDKVLWPRAADHRKVLTHAPLAWVPLLLVVIFTPPFGLVGFLGVMGHMVLDSIDYGVMWRWPRNRNVYALMHPGVPRKIFPGRREGEGIFRFAGSCVKGYYWTPLRGHYSLPTAIEIAVTLGGAALLLW